MNIFLDTSSLFKLYFQENGSTELDQLFELHSIEQIYLSALAGIEFRSIVWRRVRMNEITVQQATLLLNAFDEDYASYTIIATDESLLELSRQLLDKYGQRGLRSLDSLQLASAITVKANVQLFKTADDLLNTFFTAETLPISIG
ncbi:type II toxin-antitoxin system VapC family toxin [Spirosoma aerophilum]